MTELFTLARLGAAGHEVPVVRSGGRLLDARSVASDFDAAFFAGGGLDRVRDALGELPEFDGEGQRVGAPIARPGKIVCIGLNYRDHAEETGAAHPGRAGRVHEGPVDHGRPVRRRAHPARIDQDRLGGRARRRDRHARPATSPRPTTALDHVAGYAISHDVSEREFQLERGGQWDKGKSCETFNPFGPDLVPADEVGDPQQLGLRLWVNGESRQDGSTGDMIFPVAHVIWYLSQFMVLHPGDVINTGTPAGVALGLPGTPYLRAGDVVELEIDGLGRASQRMVQA